MTLPKISELYSILTAAKSKLESSELIEEIDNADQELIDDVIKFNALVFKLSNAMNSNNSDEVIELLINIRIQSMNIESIFSNLTDELTHFITKL